MIDSRKMEAKRSWLSILILLIMWSLYSSFQEVVPLTKKEMVQQEIQKKIEEYRAAEQRNCTVNALAEAKRQVDSIMIARAMIERIDTIQRPTKPIKPNRPTMKLPSDNSPVKPLIKE